MLGQGWLVSCPVAFFRLGEPGSSYHLGPAAGFVQWLPGAVAEDYAMGGAGSRRTSIVRAGWWLASCLRGDGQMALLEEMQLLVNDLEVALTRRTGAEHERQEVAAEDARERVAGEHERQEVAAEDARERAAGERERQEVAAEDARERAADMSERVAVSAQDARDRMTDIGSRQVEVAQALEEFHAERLTQAAEDARERAADERERQETAAHDARERATDERERRAAAGQDARERAAEMLALEGIWSGHATIMGSGR